MQEVPDEEDGGPGGQVRRVPFVFLINDGHSYVGHVFLCRETTTAMAPVVMAVVICHSHMCACVHLFVFACLVVG